MRSTDQESARAQHKLVKNCPCYSITFRPALGRRDVEAYAAFELANPLMRFPQGTHRDDVLVRGDRRRGTSFEASLPLPHHAGLDIEVARDLRQSLLAFSSCWTTPRLNSTVKTRRPSPMRPSRPAAAG